jgi:hypothetical protein
MDLDLDTGATITLVASAWDDFGPIGNYTVTSSSPN